MKKLTSSIVILGSALCITSCALVTVPVKVAGKVATTSVGVAGKVAGAGVDMVTPNKKDEAEAEKD